MGGSSGGLSNIDLSKLTKVAEDRLRDLAKSGTRILFACEKADRKALDSHLKRSDVFDSKKSSVFDSGEESKAMAGVDTASVIIVFTDEAKDCSFLDRVVESALKKKKQGIHAKAQNTSLIPSRATAYRWPSLDWAKLEEMFKA
jgi:hypothetical protein